MTALILFCKKGGNDLFGLEKLFQRKRMDIAELAELLKTDRKTLEIMEENYRKNIMKNDAETNNLFEISAKTAIKKNKACAERVISDSCDCEDVVRRIVSSLLSRTTVFSYDRTKTEKALALTNFPCAKDVAMEEVLSIPPSLRPQLTGERMCVDISGDMSYVILMEYFQKFMTEPNEQKAKQYYYRFRQGLDILDLDEITYQMIQQNPNSIGYWLPKIVSAVESEGFFKIPNTKIISVPLPLLQLTRKPYNELSPTTLSIVDEFCRQAFGLEDDGDYFIKTGTYSSKFDFRNAHVVGKDEVRTLGEYLLYIHFQALSMAHTDLSGRNQPAIFGVSTTTEWCVREFIKDEDDALTIYNGLPLHPEFRVFVDFDTKEVLGVHNYWDEDKVLPHLQKQAASDSSGKNLHDCLTFASETSRLKEEYGKYKDEVVRYVLAFIQNCPELHGQWSVDVMKNGENFWLIDMAIAKDSTYYQQAVPKELRRPMEENWLPK